MLTPVPDQTDQPIMEILEKVQLGTAPAEDDIEVQYHKLII